MWETGSRANFADWREYDAVAVWELAALMAGIDPRALSDVVGPDGDALDLSAEQEAVIAGVHAGAIECGQFEQPPITPKTIIKMAVASPAQPRPSCHCIGSDAAHSHARSHHQEREADRTLRGQGLADD